MRQYFPKPCVNHLLEILMLKLIHLIMQQKQVSKTFPMLNTTSFALKSNLASLKTEVDNLDIDKLKGLPNNLSNLKNRIDKLDIDKLVAVPVD